MCNSPTTPETGARWPRDEAGSGNRHPAGTLPHGLGDNKDLGIVGHADARYGAICAFPCRGPVYETGNEPGAPGARAHEASLELVWIGAAPARTREHDHKLEGRPDHRRAQICDADRGAPRGAAGVRARVPRGRARIGARRAEGLAADRREVPHARRERFARGCCVGRVGKAYVCRSVRAGGRGLMRRVCILWQIAA